MIKIREKEGGLEINTDSLYLFYCKRGNDEWVTMACKNPSDKHRIYTGFLLSDKDCYGADISGSRPDIPSVMKKIEEKSYKLSEKEKAEWMFSHFGEPPKDEYRLFELLCGVYTELETYLCYLVGL